MFHPLSGALLLLHLSATSATKWYSGGREFSEPAAWIDNYLPCASDLVVFPEDFPAVMPLPANISIAGFVLPRDGALLLSRDGSIKFDGLGGGKCNSEDEDERVAQLKPVKPNKWFNPNTWRDTESKPLKLDLEAIPCNDEHVVIPRTMGPLAFDIEGVEYLRLGQLSLAGSSISRTYLQQLLSTDIGRLLFRNADNTIVEYYRSSVCGCHLNTYRLTEPVCHNIMETCERPHCLAPVVPLGGCCAICASIMSFQVDQCLEKERTSILSYINDSLTNEDLTNELLVHVSYVTSDGAGKVLQTVIIDRDTYNERSTKFVQRLMEARNQTKLLANRNNLTFRLSGRPYNPNVTFGSVLLILFCLVLVSIVALIVLAYYMPENRYLNRIPQWIHNPRRWRWHGWRHWYLGMRPIMLFARFDNVGAGAANIAGSGVENIGGNEPIMGYHAENEEVCERAFNNPMFGEAPATSKAVEKQQSGATIIEPPKMEVGELDSCSGEEQELTEINLDSSEAESDGEAETAK